VASSRRLHQEKAEDERVDVTGYIGPFYPKIIISNVLGPRGIVVFSLLFELINRILEGCGFLPLLLFSFTLPSLERESPELFSFQ
jgi:hypothetical protein